MSRGEYGHVYLTLEDRQRLAKHMNMKTSAFTRRYCTHEGGIWHLKEPKDSPDCTFLKGKQCGVYEARPTQCRTWPFWPELMNAKAWQRDVVEFCPGAGKGRVYTRDEIAAIVKEQKDSEARWD